MIKSESCRAGRTGLAFTLGVTSLILAAGLLFSSGAFGAEPNHPPLLLNPQVKPYNSNVKDHYRFRVFYADPDCDAPRVIQVLIDGQAYDLRKVGTPAPSKRNPNPKPRGRLYNVWYESSVLSFEPGPHKYAFYCEDAQGLAYRAPRYGEWTGPYVARKCRPRYNTYPVLSEGRIVQGDVGDVETYFTFAVNFSDYDSTPPKAVAVVIDGIHHAMKLRKGTPANGSYIYNTYLDAPPHAYYFTAVDFGGAHVSYPTEGFLRGPTVDDVPNGDPILSEPKVDPELGGLDSRYTFRVWYHDAEKDPPAVIQVYVDDFPHNMKLANGKRYSGAYEFSTRLGLGTFHTYYFRAEDGRGGEATVPLQGTISGPVVVNQ